ncbi:MAG: hypothetical protein PHN18_09120 [Sulfurospirillaceae bacterium]|nr:hypothetical protein [Sulfurospirillaceae bacterium]MDD2826728.1 hypothetical protein [Sulfurospirillaceae bacterium]
MGISIQKLESLVDTVVLPFEKFILADERLALYLADPEVAKIHNFAVAKLTIYSYSDLNRAYAYIQKGAKAHREKKIPLENLKEFYSLYFELCKEWNQQNREADDRYGTNLAMIEQFVYEAFKKVDESKENFYIYGSDVLKQDIEKMHYRDDAKVSAEDFYAEGSMDALDILDIVECCSALSEVVQDHHIAHDEAYFRSVNNYFHAYAMILEKNAEFKDIGFSLFKLSEFLENYSATLPEHTQKKKALVVLNAIVDDLISWAKSVLQERTAVDIHYLDASLLSSIIQLEMLFAPVAEENDDELEFF